MKVKIYIPKEEYKDNIVVRNPVYITTKNKILELYEPLLSNNETYGVNKISDIECKITFTMNKQLYHKSLILEDLQSQEKNLYFITESKLIWEKEYNQSKLFHYEVTLVLHTFYRDSFDWRKISGNVERTNHRFYTYEVNDDSSNIESKHLLEYYKYDKKKGENVMTIKLNTSNLHREKINLPKSTTLKLLLTRLKKNDKYYWINNNKINFSEVPDEDFINTNIIRKPKYESVNKEDEIDLIYTSTPNIDYFNAFNVKPLSFLENDDEDYDNDGVVDSSYTYQENWRNPYYFLEEIKPVTINQETQGGYLFKNYSWNYSNTWENTYSQVTMYCTYIDKKNKITIQKMKIMLPERYDDYINESFAENMERFIKEKYDLTEFSWNDVMSKKGFLSPYVTYIRDDASGKYFLGNKYYDTPPNEYKISLDELSKKQKSKLNVDVYVNNIQRRNKGFLKKIFLETYKTEYRTSRVEYKKSRSLSDRRWPYILRKKVFRWNPILWFNDSFIEESISSDNIIHPINYRVKQGSSPLLTLPIVFASDHNIILIDDILYYTQEDLYNGKSVIEYDTQVDVMTYINSDEIISEKSLSFLNANNNQLQLQKRINEQNLIMDSLNNTVNFVSSVVNPTNLITGLTNSSFGFINSVLGYSNELNRMDAKIKDLQKTYDRISGTDDLNIKFNESVYHSYTILTWSLMDFFTYYYNKFGWKIDLFTNDLGFMNHNLRSYNYIKMSSIEFTDLPAYENYTKTLLLNGVWYIPEPLDNNIVNGINFKQFVF